MSSEEKRRPVIPTRKMVDAALTLFVLIGHFYFTHGHAHVGYVHVDIDKGTLRGFNSTVSKGPKYFTFKGIPYAKHPVGELRFKGPEEEASWSGVRDALEHGSVCPHLEIGTNSLKGREDCLFLNVFTPTLRDERLPVMFWIPAGSFVYGSGNDDIFGPDYFMDAGNVVLVTINYRLGALGFLATEDPTVPGNAGLKDQILALKWVQRNIAKFGGDPEEVTIFGGGTGVDHLLLSPISKGLFAKAISQSGSALNPWAHSEDVVKSTIRLAEVLGAKNVAMNSSKALEFLKGAPYQDIVRVQNTLTNPPEKRIRVGFPFAPSVDKRAKPGEAVLTEIPLKIMQSGNYHKVPLLTGYNTNEGYLLHDEIVKEETIQSAIRNTEGFVPRDIKKRKLRKDVAESIRRFYFDDEPIGHGNISNLVDLYSDVCFAVGITRATKFRLESSNAPTYFYVFSYDGGFNLLKQIFNYTLPGAANGDEIGYLFKYKLPFWKKPVHGPADGYVRRTMIRLWTNFAKFGDPTPPGDSLTWRPVTIDSFNYLHISGRHTQLAVNPDKKRADFWAEVYERNSATDSSEE